MTAEQQSRMNRFHRGAGAIDTLQFAVAVKDENTVRHRVESRFPLGLPARHHFKQFGLRDTDGDSFREGFYQRDFIFIP